MCGACTSMKMHSSQEDSQTVETLISIDLPDSQEMQIWEGGNDTVGFVLVVNNPCRFHGNSATIKLIRFTSRLAYKVNDCF